MLRPADVHVAIATQNADLATDRRPCAMAAALADAGYRVSLVGPTVAPDAEPAIAHPSVAFRRFDLPRPASGAVGQVREQLTATFRLAATALRIAKDDPIDVLHVGNPPDHGWIVALALRLARRRRVVFVYDQHDPAPLLVRDKFGTAPAMRVVEAALRWLERASLRRAQLVVFANAPFADRARALGFGGRSVVAPNGWDLPAAGADTEPRWPTDRPVLAYVGTTGTQDCIEQLVEAAALVPRPVRVVVAGDGDALPAARARAQELGVAESFTWLGWVRDRATIALLIRTADCCVSPEVESPANDVTSFVKVIEYMSAGAPTAAHRLPQTEAIAGETLEYAADPSPAALAQAIERVLADPAAARARAESARERFETQLRWESVGARRVVEAYADAVLPLLAGRPDGQGLSVQTEGE